MKLVSTIQDYLNGVKKFYELTNRQVPELNSFDIRLTLKGLRKLKSYTIHQASVITPEMLLKFRNHLDLNDPLHATFWSLILTSYYGLLRSSNVTFNKKLCNAECILKRGDIISTNTILFCS